VIEILEAFFEQEDDEDISSLIKNPENGTAPSQNPDAMHASTTANEGSSTQDVEFKI